MGTLTLTLPPLVGTSALSVRPHVPVQPWALFSNPGLVNWAFTAVERN